MKIKDCIFCQERKEVVLLKGQNFSFIIDCFPLVTGHIMLASHDHYACVGELEEDLFQEFCDLRQRLHDLYLRQGIAWIEYEHGRAGHCTALKSQGCEHLHYHFLPLSFPLNQKIRQDYKPKIPRTFQDIRPLSHAFGHYLWAYDAFEGPIFYPAHNIHVPSHYIRSVIADHIGHPERSDWQSFSSMTIDSNILRSLRNDLS